MGRRRLDALWREGALPREARRIAELERILDETNAELRRLRNAINGRRKVRRARIHASDQQIIDAPSGVQYPSKHEEFQT